MADGNGGNNGNGNGNGGGNASRAETEQKTLYENQRRAAEEAEKARIDAQTALEKAKTDYLIEQMKGLELPDPAKVLVEPEEKKEIGGFSPLVFVGLYLLYDHFKKKKGR